MIYDYTITITGSTYKLTTAGGQSFEDTVPAYADTRVQKGGLHAHIKTWRAEARLHSHSPPE